MYAVIKAVAARDWNAVDQALSSVPALHQQDDEGCTPAYLASREGDVALLQYLRNRGADITQPRTNGATPTFTASGNGHLAVVQYLREQGADIDQPNIDGVTPTWIASQNGHDNIVEYLIFRGADISKCRNDGWSPIEVADHKGHRRVVKLLHDAGAIVSPRLTTWTKLKTKIQKPAYVVTSEAQDHLREDGDNRGDERESILSRLPRELLVYLLSGGKYFTMRDIAMLDNAISEKALRGSYLDAVR